MTTHNPMNSELNETRFLPTSHPLLVSCTFPNRKKVCMKILKTFLKFRNRNRKYSKRNWTKKVKSSESESKAFSTNKEGKMRVLDVPDPVYEDPSSNTHKKKADPLHKQSKSSSESLPKLKPKVKSKQKKAELNSTKAKSSTNESSSADERIKKVDTPILSLYDVKTRLGKGAYGIVWEATEKGTGRTVALKKIFDAFRNSTDSQRTYREIMFLKEFGHHPNIISLLSVHKAGNEQDIYLVFPYMTHDLHKLIKFRADCLTDDRIKYVVYQILIALKYLHSAEVIHRDLKPANILMNDNLQVKVADFGLARSLTNDFEDSVGGQEPVSQIMTDYVATRWYRPPEILLTCKTYTKGVDLWSMGCILGEMLLKKPLFAGNNTIHQIQTILKSIDRPTDEDVEELCSKSLTKGMTPSVIRSGLEERGESLEEIFQQSGYEAIDILEQFLVFNPIKRLTVDHALIHPFFSSVRDPNFEWVCDRLIRPVLSDNVRLHIDDYRNAIYQMIDREERPHELRCPTAYQNPTENMEKEEEIEWGDIPESDTADNPYEDKYNDQDEYDLVEEEAGGDQEEYFTYDGNDTLMQHEEQKRQQSSSPIPLEITEEVSKVGNNQLMKSISDPTANASLNYFATKGSNPEVRQAKNISILTIPSEMDHPKPVSVPMTLSHRHAHNTQLVTTASGSDLSSKLNPAHLSMDNEGIVHQFQSLCQKYELTMDEDLADEISFEGSKTTNLTNDKLSKAKKAQSLGNYEFLSCGDLDKFMGKTTRLKSFLHASDKKLRVATSSFVPTKQPVFPYNEQKGDGDNNARRYDQDLQKIQGSLVQQRPEVINPYKPRGLKTSYDNQSSSANDDPYQDFRTSQPFAPVPDAADRDASRRRDELPYINNVNATSSGYQLQAQREELPHLQNPYLQHPNVKISTRNNNTTLDIHSVGSKGYQNRQPSNPPPPQPSRLKQLVLQSKDNKVRDRGNNGYRSQSEDSLNNGESLILINGKSNSTSKRIAAINLQRQKRPVDPVRKFTFNQNNFKEEEQANQNIRPYGGRQYDKKFHGPSFHQRLGISQSLSDTEAARNQMKNSWKPKTASILDSRMSGVPTDTDLISRKPVTHSAYFPHSGVTHPLSNLRANSRSSHSVPNNVSSNYGNFTPSQPSQSYSSTNQFNSHYKSKEYLHNNANNNALKMEQLSRFLGAEETTDSHTSTIRASELFELRNNLSRRAKNSRNGKKY